MYKINQNHPRHLNAFDGKQDIVEEETIVHPNPTSHGKSSTNEATDDWWLPRQTVCKPSTTKRQYFPGILREKMMQTSHLAVYPENIQVNEFVG